MRNQTSWSSKSSQGIFSEIFSVQRIIGDSQDYYVL